jgi:hypothetical protein
MFKYHGRNKVDFQPLAVSTKALRGSDVFMVIVSGWLGGMGLAFGVLLLI